VIVKKLLTSLLIIGCVSALSGHASARDDYRHTRHGVYRNFDDWGRFNPRWVNRHQERSSYFRRNHTEWQRVSRNPGWHKRYN
jgi:hypothetical protein